jgi:NhaA family Na+:H+ antiporter
MPFLPHAARDPGFFVDASPGSRDTLSRFEIFWRYPAQAALFFFGLVNAGVQFGALEEGTWALPVAVLVGKPVGILFGAGLAVVAGLPPAASRRVAGPVAVGFIAAIGFQRRTLFFDGAPPPGQLAIRDQRGRAAEPRRPAAGIDRRLGSWRRQVRCQTGFLTSPLRDVTRSSDQSLPHRYVSDTVA